MKAKTKRVETIAFDVHVTQDDIENGECRLAMRCMHKLAVARAIFAAGLATSDASARVRVDAGHVTFNALGARWKADAPKALASSLIQFDRDKSKVRPHKYRLNARKVSVIQRISPERQEQVNAARRKRAAEGKPDRLSNRLTLRKRIVGFA